jgi:DNA-binding NarL/FixJ family response regulator
MANHTYISPTVAAELIDPEKPQSPSRPGFEPLTMRQREILQLFAEGKTMKEIATMTNLSTRTVEWHKYRMMKMLNIRRSSQLIQHAVRMKLVI